MKDTVLLFWLEIDHISQLTAYSLKVVELLLDVQDLGDDFEHGSRSLGFCSILKIKYGILGL
jgi:hypothetical protein